MPRFESLKAQHRNTGDVDVWFGQNGNTSHLEVDFAVDGRLSDKHGYNNNNNKYNCNVGAGRASLPPPEAPRVVFDRLDIKMNKGFVYLTNTHVSEEVKVVSEQNAVVGQVTANKRIEIESKLHTTLSLISSNASDLLMVSAETVAQVSMQSPFYGNVALTTWVSFFRPEVFFTPRDTFVQQTKTLQTLTGYFPYANGAEPESPFPRVTVNGEQASFALTSPSLPSFLHSRTGQASLKIAQTNK
ncbi:hypothetical protein BGZ88_008014 [Linnemannia elongata]|nr:hypothetical protein BGZ88_008014 [Linnemannia elongata]